MKEKFTISKGENYETYVEHDGRWFRFNRDSVDIRGRKSTHYGPELRDDKVEDLIAWMREHNV